MTAPGDTAPAETEAQHAARALVIAFIQGAAWWEYQKEGATMWQSDKRLAMEAAEARAANGTLGVPPPG